MSSADERRGLVRSLHATLLRSHVMRAFLLRPRLIIGILAGFFVGLICPQEWRLATRLLLAGMPA